MSTALAASNGQARGALFCGVRIVCGLSRNCARVRTRELYLDNNRFTGTIPAALGKMVGVS